MPYPPSLFWLVNRKEGQPGSTAATPSWGAALPTFPYSLISLDVRGMIHVLWSSPWLTYRLLLCLLSVQSSYQRAGQAGLCLHSVASSGLGTWLGIEGAQACPENHTGSSAGQLTQH